MMMSTAAMVKDAAGANQGQTAPAQRWIGKGQRTDVPTNRKQPFAHLLA
jgi:hypothetical protein